LTIQLMPQRSASGPKPADEKVIGAGCRSMIYSRRAMWRADRQRGTPRPGLRRSRHVTGYGAKKRRLRATDRSGQNGDGAGWNAPDDLGAEMTRAADGIAVVMPRNMRFTPERATSIDLYTHEIARTSRHADAITIFAERVEQAFGGVEVRFWEPGAGHGARTRLIAETRPRLVVVNQHLPSAVAIARRLPAVPVVLLRHNFLKPPRGPFSALWRRRQFGRLTALAFVSQCCRDAFRADWPRVGLPIFVTPNGIDLAAWRPAPVKLNRIIFTGRLAPEKGVLEAVEALAQVLPRHADWGATLVLATDAKADAYARSVEQAVAAAAGRITVRRNIPHDEVRSILSTAAVALAPTQNAEPFGRVAIEALASGAALIATRRGGFVEIVGDAGVLIDPPSAEGIAGALESLMTTPELRDRLASLGPRRVAGRYDLASAAAAFDSMIDALMAGRAP
jgi:glycosyltransferase involved in cell wall biosynthesis